MAVIINDFEVVSEPGPSESPAADGNRSPPAPAAAAPRPEDVEQILRYFDERRARVAAD